MTCSPWWEPWVALSFVALIAFVGGFRAGYQHGFLSGRREWP